MFIGARAVAGVGGSALLTGSMTLIAMSFPIAKRSVVNGILLGLFATFQAVGPVIGGASWPWCFYMCVQVSPLCSSTGTAPELTGA